MGVSRREDAPARIARPPGRCGLFNLRGRQRRATLVLKALAPFKAAAGELRESETKPAT